MTPLDRVECAINEAASRITTAKPSGALRVNVMSRISPLRAPRVGRHAGLERWRFLLAGGAIASVAVVAFISWPSNRAIPNPTISTPTVVNPTVINVLADPTVAVNDPSPLRSVANTARIERVMHYAPSAAELEWATRATPALAHADPLEVKSLELKSIDITPLAVAPLVVPALADGSNR